MRTPAKLVASGHAGTVSSSRGLRGRRPPPAEFRQDIEGLRAAAVLAVVIFHAGVPGVGGGYVGVDVFLVISGFLITGLLWREVSAAGTPTDATPHPRRRPCRTRARHRHATRRPTDALRASR
jgi:hypothetical protein